MKRFGIVIIAGLLMAGLVLAGCAKKAPEAGTQGLTKEEKKAVDYVLSYTWTDPSTGKKSAKNIGDSIKKHIGVQPWSGGLTVLELGNWEVDKLGQDVFLVHVLVTPNAKAWAKAGKKTKPPTEAVWRVDYKEKRVLATNLQAGFLSWVEK